MILFGIHCNSQVSAQGLWTRGKVNSENDLILVEIRNRDDCRGFEQDISVSLKLDWGIMLFNGSNKPSESFYAILDNETNQIYRTSSFKEFLIQVKLIPDSVTVREFEKCTVPFSHGVSQPNRDALMKTLSNKGCILESKLMYCNCCAETETFTF